ncbi:MAG: hypothetical protein OHK0040_05660 [bacterium]
MGILFLFFVSCSKPKDFVIKVGDKEVRKEELQALFQKTHSDTPAKKTNVISQLIESIILEEEAKKMGLSLSKGEIDDFMKENAITEQNKDSARLYLLRQKVANLLAKDLQPSKERVEALANEMKDVLSDKYIFQQVLLNKEETAYKVLEEIKKGMPFEEAARQYSISPEGKKGGLIDYLDADEIPVELSKALKKMEIGEVSGVISSPFGFHILKKREFIKSKKLTQEEKEALARKEAEKEAAGDNYADWFAKKRKEYNVIVKWEEVEKLK